jgi:hypothetical protein
VEAAEFAHYSNRLRPRIGGLARGLAMHPRHLPYAAAIARLPMRQRRTPHSLARSEAISHSNAGA